MCLTFHLQVAQDSVLLLLLMQYQFGRAALAYLWHPYMAPNVSAKKYIFCMHQIWCPTNADYTRLCLIDIPPSFCHTPCQMS